MYAMYLENCFLFFGFDIMNLEPLDQDTMQICQLSKIFGKDIPKPDNKIVTRWGLEAS